MTADIHHPPMPDGEALVLWAIKSLNELPPRFQISAENQTEVLALLCEAVSPGITENPGFGNG